MELYEAGEYRATMIQTEEQVGLLTEAEACIEELASSTTLEKKTYHHLQPPLQTDIGDSDLDVSSASDAGTFLKNEPQQPSSTDSDQAAVIAATTVSGVTKTKPKRKKRHIRDNKNCGVCGDVATAHNFGALTCDTCKAFFRRNANRTQKIPPCSFEKQCVINKTTRRFCPSCRLQKCFTIGMDANFILDEEEKKAMRARRKKKQESSEKMCAQDSLAHDMVDPSQFMATSGTPRNMPQDTTGSEDANSLFGQFPPSPFSSLFNSIHCDDTMGSNTNLLSSQSAPFNFFAAFNELCGDETQNSEALADGNDAVSTVQSSCGMSSSMNQTESSHSASCSCSNKKPLAQGRNFCHVERDQLPWDNKQYWLLTEEERKLLTHLTNSFADVHYSTGVYAPWEQTIMKRPLCVEKLLFLLEKSIKRSVSFAKSVSDFKDLLEVDQIACLKSTAMEAYALRSAAIFVIEREAWNTLMGDMTVSDVRAMLGGHSIVNSFLEYCISVKSVLRNNTTLYALMSCICLFDVRHTTVKQRDKVNELRDKYLLLLKHYLESEFSYLHANRYLVEILALEEDAHSQRPSTVIFFKQFSSLFRPLIAEFFTM